MMTGRAMLSPACAAVFFALLLGFYDLSWARITGLVLYSGG